MLRACGSDRWAGGTRDALTGISDLVSGQADAGGKLAFFTYGIYVNLAMLTSKRDARNSIEKLAASIVNSQGVAEVVNEFFVR